MDISPQIPWVPVTQITVGFSVFELVRFRRCFSSETNFHPKQWDALPGNSTLGLGRPARVLHGKELGSVFLGSWAGWSAQVFFWGKPSRNVAKKGFPKENV